MRRWWTAVALLTIALVPLAAGCVSSIAADALLHPARSTRKVEAPNGCVERTFDGADVGLRGWYCRTSEQRRASLIFLHGVADTRAGTAGLSARFMARGFDVVAYDSRAHGESGGDFCTYGYVEKRDLRRVIDVLSAGPVVLLGTSLGAAVALQEAADDPRVSGVVAAEVFADLATVARERVPRWLPGLIIRQAFRAAERQARFEVDSVSPLRAAQSISVPVLLIHGAADVDTRPDHSRRVLAALRGRKRLLLIEGARHNESLRGASTWREIDQWLDDLLPAITSR